MSIFKRRSLQILGLGAVALILSLAFYKVWKYQGISFGGDEPHYLIMTRSLILDGDLNLKNDYAAPSRYHDFWSGALDTHYSNNNPRHQSFYSVHGAGIPIMLVPIMKYLGLRGVVVFMCGWAAIVSVLVWIWAFRLTRSSLWSTLGTGALVLSLSFLSLAGHVFPDLIVAALLLGSALLLSLKRRWWSNLILGVIIGILPWIHVKTLIVAATIGLVAIWPYIRRKSHWHEAFWLILPAAGLLAAFELSLMAWYGTLLPNHAFGSANQLFNIPPWHYLAAGLFDGTKGFLPNNPAMALIPLGLGIWWQKDRRSLGLVALLIVPTLLLQSSFDDWWGGWSPTGRYWLEFIPLLIPAIAYLLLACKGYVVRLIALAGFLVQLKFAQIYLSLKVAWPLPGDPNPVFATIQARHRLNLQSWLPRFLHLSASRKSWLLAGMYAFALIAGGIFFSIWGGKPIFRPNLDRDR